MANKVKAIDDYINIALIWAIDDTCNYCGKKHTMFMSRAVCPHCGGIDVACGACDQAFCDKCIWGSEFCEVLSDYCG